MLKILRFLSFLALSSCAIISSPEGGEKDITPPEIIKTSPPNQSTQFNVKQIVIEFDEYVSLNGFGSQFYSSPPLTGRVDPRLKGKRLYLTLNEDLLPNTTYTFSFGTAIADITEKNVQANFKYVFSTGDELDSLKIEGVALDAYTGKPQPKMLAMLYPTGISDSALLNQKPTYYTVTDENGQFSLENLALDTFQLFIVQDENINLKYDEGAEKYGFYTEPVISRTDKKFIIRAFQQQTKLRLLETNQKGFGQIALYFSQPAENLNVRIVGDENFPAPSPTFLVPDENGDTVHFWYNPKIYPDDMAFLFLNVQAQDFKSDSIRILLKKNAPFNPTLALLEKGAIKPNGAVLLESKTPMVTIDTTLVSLMEGENNIPFVFEQHGPMAFALDFDRKYGQEQTLYLAPGALIDVYGVASDSIKIPLKVDDEDNLAILKLNLTAADNLEKVLQLYELSTKQIIAEHAFTTQINLLLKDIKPTKYGLRIIWDENKNGQYDAGTFTNRGQPEQVIYYPKPIELRANWELETVWEIPLKPR